NKAALLFMNQSYYPGWTAFVDGKTQEVFRANYLFQAVRVPAGTHEVRLRYTSPPLKRGVFLSILGLILFIGAIAWLCIKKSPKKIDETLHN
ncbi:MAG: YfhO family protein, partial [Candidatus Azambacteria bacterium]|nr:YfhO family protein [Candidatus Azambacteria bacterium]